MNPLMLALGGAGGLATLLGGRKELSLADLEKMFGAGALGGRANELFGLLANSESFRNAVGNANITGQNLGQNINQNLARAGLDTSGIGAVASGLGNAASGFNISNLIGNLQGQALNKAGDLNSLLANLFLGTRQSGPTGLQTLGGSVLGALGPSFLKGRPAGANNSAGNFDWMNSWNLE